MLVIGIAAPAQAGHELPYYPSFYPQGIRVESVDSSAVPALLSSGALHAVIGVDPFATTPRGTAQIPAGLSQVVSLGSYIVLTLDGASARLEDAANRCAGARATLPIFRRQAPGFEFYPYPVTPFHADYLYHADLIASMKKTVDTPHPAAAKPAGGQLRLRVLGPTTTVLADAVRATTGPWDATVEEVGVDELLAGHVSAFNALSAPPWMKEGWFHAYLLLAGSIRDRVVRDRVHAVYRRLTEGRYRDVVEQVNLERKLVSLLTAGCERMVVGYTLRREYYNADYSAGIENVAFDSQSGLNSAIFIRTAKLKEFPWNGWLRVGVPRPPTAAWNPVAGFSDPFGKFLWSALADPALLPAPYGSTWMPDRVEWTGPLAQALAPGSGTPPAARARDIPIPDDAMLPVPGTGIWQRIGPGRTAAVKLVYRVRTSLFHDGTTMTLADALYALAFAYRWSATSTSATTAADPQVEAATHQLRTWLAAIKVLRTEDEVKKLFDIELKWKIPVLEVYLNYAPTDPQAAAVVAPTWSPIPWHLLALMEAASQRGIAAFSASEAQRRRVPWLDLVRDRVVKERLAQLAEEFARTGYRPPALQGYVTAAEATERWNALQQFYRQWGHLLVTSGPYRLETWSARDATLVAFRDLSYPLIIGTFDKFAIPRRAYVSSVVRGDDGLEVAVDVERLLKFQRSFRIIREPLGHDSSAGLDLAKPVCRYVVVRGDGQVAQTGVATDAGHGVFHVEVGGVRTDQARVFVVVYLNDNSMNAEVTEVALGDN